MEEQEVIQHNERTIEFLGQEAEAFLEDLLDGCYINGKIELVDGPEGTPQYEEFGPYKKIHVDQWSTGMSGDTFAGYIYAKVGKQWIKVPYYC